MTSKNYSCGLDAALAVVGGKWKCLILWNLAHNKYRFSELKKRVAGISEKMLIQELKKMELDKIVIRKNFNEVPPRVEYSLTPFGLALIDVLDPLSRWGSKNIKKIAKLHSQATT